jgi:hypothetical protein
VSVAVPRASAALSARPILRCLPSACAAAACAAKGTVVRVAVAEMFAVRLQSIRQVHWICRYRCQMTDIQPKAAKWGARGVSWHGVCTVLDEEPDKLLAARMGCAAAGARLGGGVGVRVEPRFVKDVRRWPWRSSLLSPSGQPLLLSTQRLEGGPQRAHSWWSLERVQVASPCDFLRYTRAG